MEDQSLVEGQALWNRNDRIMLVFQEEKLEKAKNIWKGLQGIKKA